MSASTPLATVERTFQNQRFVPKGDVTRGALDRKTLLQIFLLMEFCRVPSLTMKQASVSSTVRGGGKRRLWLFGFQHMLKRLHDEHFAVFPRLAKIH